MKKFSLWLSLIATLSTQDAFADVFDREARARKIDGKVLEGICRYESDNGRIKIFRNKNGSFDVGFCMNHREKGDDERIPTMSESIVEAARELAYWKMQHDRFCVDVFDDTGSCFVQHENGRKHGITNCDKDHPWWAHYNWGFRVLDNGYDRRVGCFIENGFKKCDRIE